MIISLIIVVLAVGAGFVMFARNVRGLTAAATAVRPQRERKQLSEDRSGWVYFIAGEDTAVKVGVTQHEPTVSPHAAESPVPLKLYYKQWVPDRLKVQTELYEELGDSRLYGEWFDRDVALYYAAHLRGEI